ncbi:exonuclease domain-containing protein [Streptomyces sp. NPDC059582]|uniref:exonuclease domain-containing protein n=1 Tax=Streptomyces sp. NPDC059582 TaxID=3346875 RepID=UPI0036C2A6AE
MTDSATTTSPPVYERRDLPEDLKHLRTITELKQQRLKPADGQEPVAFVRVYRSGHGWGEFPLYDPADAAAMRPLSAKQQAAKTARRTCPECRTVCEYIVYQRCESCRRRAQQEAQARQTRTCHRCRRESGAPLSKDVHEWPACAPCRIQYAVRHQVEEERRAVWARTCPGHPREGGTTYDCAVQTATDEEITAGRAAVTWQGPLRCPPCAEAFDRWRANLAQAAQEQERRAEEARRRQVADLEAWARDVLADPDTVFLDTETTGLEDDARIVDLAVTDRTGQPLLDTLINPGQPIPPDATDIHGITDDHVREAPTFDAILPQLATVLGGRRCVIYNRSFDVSRLRHELTVRYRQHGHPDPEVSAAVWLDNVRFEDAMIPYSDWVGDWSDYWGNYTWQPLYGGNHRALSDCQAVTERLREMAAGHLADADV